MKPFVAVFKVGDQAYYSLFNFDVTDIGVVAYVEYVRTWPQHQQLEKPESSAILDATYQGFLTPMTEHIQRELLK